MKKSGVYQILNRVNGKRYVGSSRNILRRFAKHLNTLKSGIHTNRHLQSAWDKHGIDNFIFVVLEYCTVDQLLEREQSYLPEARTIAALKAHGFYNICPIAGSHFGVRHSEETKKIDPKNKKSKTKQRELTAKNFRNRKNKRSKLAPQPKPLNC